ncbi:MAG TPA: DUF998 domain-containing protein [Pseudonocardiaceae bacterium]|nr:DUF998 domain-containing protein [Pseudonocardiaceae bacterium]
MGSHGVDTLGGTPADLTEGEQSAGGAQGRARSGVRVGLVGVVWGALGVAVLAIAALHLIGVGRLDPVTTTVSDYVSVPGGPVLLSLSMLAVAVATAAVPVGLLWAGLVKPAGRAGSARVGRPADAGASGGRGGAGTDRSGAVALAVELGSAEASGVERASSARVVGAIGLAGVSRDGRHHAVGRIVRSGSVELPEVGRDGSARVGRAVGPVGLSRNGGVARVVLPTSFGVPGADAVATPTADRDRPAAHRAGAFWRMALLLAVVPGAAGPTAQGHAEKPGGPGRAGRWEVRPRGSRRSARPSRAGVAAIVLHALACAGLLAAISFPTNAVGAAVSLDTVLHRYAAGFFLVGLPVATLLSLRLLPDRAVRWLTAASVLAGLAFVASHVPLVLPDLPGAHRVAELLPRGIAERVLLLVDLTLLGALARAIAGADRQVTR